MFRIGKTGPVYYLVAGRWFSAPDFTGPWTFATPKLPEDFKQIPLEHDRSRVLASVPGTDQAIEAVLLAQVPQTARVNRTQMKAPAVAYQGAPQFEPIEGTIAAARGQHRQGRHQGRRPLLLLPGRLVRGEGRHRPVGGRHDDPRGRSTRFRRARRRITSPTSSSKTTNDNDEWVTFAYVAGYTGLMIGWGCAVWGSG